MPGGGQTQEWGEPQWDEPSQSRRWWTPILVGFVAVLMVGALAVGIWLIAQALTDRGPSPAAPSPGSGPATPTGPASPPVTSSPAAEPATPSPAPPAEPSPTPPPPPPPPTPPSPTGPPATSPTPGSTDGG
jgi:hypothetical protein